MELELLRWIRSRLGPRNGRVLIDSGDDAAVVRFGPTEVLFKTDSVIDGVHFDGRTARPEEVGHKAIARSLSDVAAMGALPSFAVVALMAPRGTPPAYLRRLFTGMNRTARRFETRIVGGDVATHRGKLAVSVALLGEPRGLPPVPRSGARAGDLVGVTGPLGGSILGKHLRFVPRVREGRELNRRFGVRAMIDISDGLSMDLGHLCEESGVGAVVDEARLPIAPAARRLSRRDGRPALEHALHDGEDYELLFALPPGKGERLERSGLGRVIGKVTSRPGLFLRRRGGRREPLPRGGWEHR